MGGGALRGDVLERNRAMRRESVGLRQRTGHRPEVKNHKYKPRVPRRIHRAKAPLESYSATDLRLAVSANLKILRLDGGRDGHRRTSHHRPPSHGLS